MDSCTTLFLVSCVSKKAEYPSRARDLYESDLFRKARAYVEQFNQPWFILSAEYGLVNPDAIIAPYDRTLNTMGFKERRAWADGVSAALVKLMPDLPNVTFLAGQRYREFLTDDLQQRGVKVNVPMEGLRIGEQLSWLRKHTLNPD